MVSRQRGLHVQLQDAAHLRRAGVPAVVLEQGAAVAPQWRGRYDRLRLNSPRWFCRKRPLNPVRFK